MVGNANTLIGMGKEPAEVGFFAESESVLEMEGKRLVDFLLLRIVSLQKTMGGDDISRTDVEAKLMADQGMADAVVPLPNGYPCVLCSILQAFRYATCRLRFVVSWFWGEKHKGYISFPTNHIPSIRCSIEKSWEGLCLFSAPYWSKATFVAQK